MNKIGGNEMKKNKIVWLISFLLVGIFVLIGCGKSEKAADNQENVDSLAAIKKAGTLKVGIEGTFPPFNFHDEKDQLKGFEVELAEAVAKKIGVKAEFVETKWDSLIAGLDVNKYDVVFNNVSVTEERQKKYDFTNPYAYSHATLAVKEDSEIKTLADLKGKKSAQTVSSNYAQDAEKLGAEVVPTDGFAQSIELVLGNRADGTVNDDVTFFYYQKEKPENKIRLIDEAIATSEIAAITNKNNPELTKAIDGALAELKKEGITSKLSITYFGKDITENK